MSKEALKEKEESCDSGCGCGCDAHENHEDEHSERRELVEMISGAILFAAGLVMHIAFDLKPVFFLPVLLVAYIILGREVLWSAVKGLKDRSVFSEDFLMSLATLGAFAIGSFDEAVGVMLFYRVGEWFEHRATGSARRSVTALLDIRPDAANLLRGGEIVSVSPEEVAVGDLILVRPGERVPLDGVVTDGFSSLDTSALTGEALPRNVAPGDGALSGCVNMTGVLTVRVEKLFSDSTVKKILELVENASAKKAPAEKFITKFARVYTPAVVLFALLLAFLPPLFTDAELTVWVRKALTLLVISCPCALVLSVPLAFFSGIGTASRRGILVKGGNYLDALCRLEVVAFDKTGTLTTGRFAVSGVRSVVDDDAALLKLAAHAEAHSTHPIARSIVEAYGGALNMESISNYEELAGNGVRATVGGDIVLAGSVKFLEREGVQTDDTSPVSDARVYIARNGRYAGFITVSDTLRPDSADAVAKLRRRGIRTVMLTGDNEHAAATVAKTLGIDEYHAGLLPADKVEVVEQLMRETPQGGKLAFLGDGINDAPVLSISDIGVAMGGLGSDAAIESADIILMTDEPSRLIDAHDIAKRTRVIVTQNIVLSLAIKLVFISIGIFGSIAMWAAVFADVGVALLAVLNSMRVGKIRK